ncbi:MAG: group 1 truncated hemoglobin [Verrucomicrobiales bacterium]|nr:group 1 truncated hemoglobin [Verrucomicrobiales bacterium]
MESSQRDKSLYERIGGEPAIERLLDHFYHRVAHDGEIGHYFTHVPIGKLKVMQREFFSIVTDGPVTYSGRPLAHVHHPLAISRREFQRFTEHLVATLEEAGIGEQDRSEIIAKINLYADEITNEESFG